MLDDKNIRIYRTYDNFLIILGNIGGLLSMLLFVAGLIVEPLSKLSLNLDLVNSFFSFEDDTPEKDPRGTKVSPLN
jgi:hypothetical protein